MTPQIRLACQYCDTNECDGITEIPAEWSDVREVQSYAAACEPIPAADPTRSPRPGLIVLDLNMPKKDGRESLREINADPSLRRIPTVVLTTSKSEEDICRSYDLGANSYIAKPVSFEALVDVTKTLGQYWFDIVELSSNGEENECAKHRH